MNVTRRTWLLRNTCHAFKTEYQPTYTRYIYLLPQSLTWFVDKLGFLFFGFFVCLDNLKFQWSRLTVYITRSVVKTRLSLCRVFQGFFSLNEWLIPCKVNGAYMFHGHEHNTTGVVIPKTLIDLSSLESYQRDNLFLICRGFAVFSL